ncbi:MAG: hypothetical protein KDA52_24915 [Planctomycetaceae bacterium]|nr:hypothetical protein [Planctomycetaceae bacterium]
MLEIPPELAEEMTPAVLAFVESLLGRIAELEARLGMTPQNSSLPPSSQYPHARPVPQKPSGKRKRGGQKGHPKHERTLLPPERVDETFVLKPSACRRCGQLTHLVMPRFGVNLDDPFDEGWRGYDSLRRNWHDQNRE